jgi:hypothetical protein
MKESDLRNPKVLQELFDKPWPKWKSWKEDDWSACNDPGDMVQFLRDSSKLSERKARLFAVACCFHCFWNLLVDDETRAAVGVAARHAEGLAETQEVMEAAASAAAVAAAREREDDNDATDISVRRTEWLYYAARAAEAAAKAVTDPLSAAFTSTFAASDLKERHLLAHFLRDIVGPLPFRPGMLSPSTRMWNSSTLARLAQAIYPGRHLPSDYLDTQRLGVLADALVDAGCTEEELIGHLRSEGPHVQGCWAVDLVLGKE